MKIRLRLLLAGVLLSGGCTAPSGAPAPAIADDTAKTFQVPANKSAVYVYRPFRPVGYGFALLKIELDDESLAVLGFTNYVYRLVEPGRHVVTGDANQEATIPARLVLDMEPGRRYFIKQHMEGSWSAFHVKLELVPDEIGIEGVRTCRLVNWIE